MNPSEAERRHRQHRIGAVYDPKRFGSLAHQIVARLEDYYSQSLTGARSLFWEPPDLRAKRESRLFAQAAENPSADPAARAEALAQHFLENCNRLHSPKYMGHQVPPPVPLAALFGLLGQATNQTPGVYEMAPIGVAAERAVIERLGVKLGWAPGKFTGIATNGGSLANLTAILAARNARYPGVWSKGVAAFQERKPAVVTSADAHYSIARSAGILGLGTEQVLKAPLDERRRISIPKLERVLDEAKNRGFDVFCLIGSACSTPIGAFDPLPELARIAKARGIWFHVDGAHGASYRLSRKYGDRVRGMEEADSIAWDAHKMLFVPALSTFVLYRDRAASFGAFDQDAPYLLAKGSSEQMEFDPAYRTVECTRGVTAAAIWGLWSVFGDQVFADLIDSVTDLAMDFHGLLRETDDFEPVHSPECNIVCFRHLPKRIRAAGVSAQSEFQLKLRRKLVEEGPFYITQTKLEGAACLRVALMNPLASRATLEELVTRLRELGRTIED